MARLGASADANTGVLKVQNCFLPASRIYVSPPPMIGHTTQDVFLFKKKTIDRSLPTPKMLGQKAKSNHYTLQVVQMIPTNATIPKDSDSLK